MMKSKKRSGTNATDIELKITKEDIPALQRSPKGLSTKDYLRFLKKISSATTVDLKSRKGPRGERFEL